MWWSTSSSTGRLDVDALLRQNHRVRAVFCIVAAAYGARRAWLAFPHASAVQAMVGLLLLFPTSRPDSRFRPTAVVTAYCALALFCEALAHAFSAAGPDLGPVLQPTGGHWSVMQGLPIGRAAKQARKMMKHIRKRTKETTRKIRKTDG